MVFDPVVRKPYGMCGDGMVGPCEETNAGSDSLIEGSYRFDAGDCCVEWTGTFSVPLLDCAPTDPSAETCCRTTP